MVAYTIAAHTVLWCDPALADDLALLTDPKRALALDGVQASLIARGWEHVSRSRMLLPPATGLIAAKPVTAAEPAILIRSFDANIAGDRSMLDTFAASLSADEREEAHLDGGEYDDHILAVVEVDGIRRP